MTSDIRLYHGTRATAAKKILTEGFKRSKSGSYTGTGTCLSESITVAYPYGMYEEGGCVLEVILRPDAKWHDGNMPPHERGSYDQWFQKTGLDAMRAFHGNVWVLWNGSAVASVRKLSHADALATLIQEFNRDGPECGYNAVVDDYASIWWGGTNANLERFPDERKRLESRLHRLLSVSTHTEFVKQQQVLMTPAPASSSPTARRPRMR